MPAVIKIYSALSLIFLYAGSAPAIASDMILTDSSVVTSASLAATVASSKIILDAPAIDSFNNTIDNGAFEKTTGITTVGQNSGANSIVQQAVTVRIDALTLAFPALEQ